MTRGKFRFIILSMLLFAILTPLRGVADIDPALIQEELLKTQSGVSYTTINEINGKQYITYAQNSPDWGELTAGVKANTRIKSSFCAVFSLSNIIVNSVPYSELNTLNALMIREPCFDTKTVAHNKGYKQKYKFVVRSEEDYLRYYPLCLANLVSGNAKISVGETRSRGYYKRVLKEYGLQYTETKKMSECIEYVRQGAYASVCTGGTNSPIAPNFGHYFVMVYADDNYVYFLDSMFRDEYPKDKEHVIEILSPGLYRVAIENVNKLAITGTKIIVWPKANRTEYTKEMLEEAIKKSNENIPKRTGE